jgi:hypothetical protein
VNVYDDKHTAPRPLHIMDDEYMLREALPCRASDDISNDGACLDWEGCSGNGLRETREKPITTLALKR